MFFQKLAVFACSLGLAACGGSAPERDMTENHSAAPKISHIQMIEFFDFGCGHCRTASHTMNNLKKHYGEKLQVEYKNFPLSARTTRVAEAAECAGKQSKYKTFHDVYFAGFFGRTADADLVSAAQASGVDPKAMMTCVNSGIMKTKISEDIALAQKYGVTGTPFFVINSQFTIPGSLPEAKFREILDQMLTQ